MPTPPVPATFRSDGLDDGDDDQEEIGMGALSLAAILAIALAALRGTAGAITDWRQRRLEAAAEAAPLRAARLKLQEAQMKADAAAAGSGGRVPSSNEYGRRALARTGGGGGTGGGRGGGSTSTGSGSGGRTGPVSSRTGSPSGAGGTGPGRKGGGSSGSGSTSPVGGPGGKGKGSSGSGKTGGSGGGSKGSTSTGSGGSTGSGSGSGGRKPGVLGQLALDRSKRRTARQAAEQKEAARQQKAERAERKRAAKTNGGAGGPDSPSSGARDRKRKRREKGGRPDSGTTSAGPGRVTLGKALGDEARRRADERLRRRREDPDTPFISRARRDDKPADGSPTAEGTAAKSTPGTETGTAGKGPQTPTSGPTATGPTPGPFTGSSGTEGDGWEFSEPPGGGGRRNPWDSLFEAMWDAEVVWTVEQIHPTKPDTNARNREPAAIGSAPAGLPAGSPSTATAAGTPMTKETRVSTPLIPMPRTGGAASEHLTDVTLDDVLRSLGKSKSDCFATYDECAVLADKARELRDQLHVLADELAQRHNVIGRLTSAAMERLAESMDVLARKAEEMRTRSMRAAEAVEVAHDEMYDAYKPVQQATADAGLVMPSARIHNED
ncbi:hypothetical protein ABT330_33695 [Streptomyces sp. NPDC000658]|uniref:hypothetical protein n=1 Tax=Streptomyces sp. NPDC000658 TaxID=3154266 RepID=UPI0033332D00